MTRNNIVIGAAVLASAVLLAGCLDSSGGESESGESESGGAEESVVETVSDLESAVRLGSRFFWFTYSRQVFEIPMQLVARGHLAEEPIEWFFLRSLLAQQAVKDIAPKGGPIEPECSAGSVEFTDSTQSLEAVYRDCRIPASDITGPGNASATIGGVDLDQPQVWNGIQRFERKLNTPDWERVYAIEHDGMTFSLESMDTPFRVLDGGEMMVRYNAVNDIEFEGSMKTGRFFPVFGAGPGSEDEAGWRLTIFDFTDVDLAWQPDGLDGTKVSGRVEFSVQATPAAEIPDSGLYGHWIVETREPIRYAQTITEERNPIDGEVHMTAEDGNTIEIVFETSGLFLDGVFLSWDRFEKLEGAEVGDDTPNMAEFVKEKFPDS